MLTIFSDFQAAQAEQNPDEPTKISPPQPSSSVKANGDNELSAEHDQAPVEEEHQEGDKEQKVKLEKRQRTRTDIFFASDKEQASFLIVLSSSTKIVRSVLHDLVCLLVFFCEN